MEFVAFIFDSLKTMVGYQTSEEDQVNQFLDMVENDTPDDVIVYDEENDIRLDMT